MTALDSKFKFEFSLNEFFCQFGKRNDGHQNFKLGGRERVKGKKMEAMEDTDTMEAAERTVVTPPPTRKRLPRVLAGTDLARERKKALSSLRQKRRRARLKQEAARPAESDSDEAAAAEVPLPDQDDLPYEPTPQRPLQDQFQAENLTTAEAELVNRRETVTEQQQTSHNSRTENERVQADITEIGKEFARLKVTSHVSDAAIDKMFTIFMTHNDAIRRMVDSGEMAASYTTGVRPTLTEQLLSVRNSLLLKVQQPGERPQYRKLTDLSSIPQEYLNLRPESHTKLLRIDTGVRLKDVKDFFFETHGGKTETLLQQTRNCSLSVDGVQESKSGSRTFTVVSVKFGTCVYLLRIYNTLIGVDESKPSAKEILRFVAKLFQICADINKIHCSDFVEEINDDDELHIKDVLADMPARRHLQGFNSPNSTFGCSYCKQAAVTRGGTHWPYWHNKADLRTTEECYHYARFVSFL